MNNVIFKANANSVIGFGHVYRLLALYEILEDHFKCSFISGILPETIKATLKEKKISFVEFEDEMHEIDYISKNGETTLVLDGYNFSPEYLRSINEIKCNLVKVDDFYESNPIFDGIINHAPLAHSRCYAQHLLDQKFALGCDYVMLRSAFLKKAQNRSIEAKKISDVFVCFGGADPQNITSIIIEELLKNDSIINIHAVSDKPIFKGNSSTQVHYYSGLNEEEMISIIECSQLAVCPPSTISLEVCAIGIPLIVIPMVDNQEGIGKGLVNKNAAYHLELKHLNKINEVIRSFSIDELRSFKHSQSELIDGKSRERFIEFFEEL